MTTNELAGLRHLLSFHEGAADQIAKLAQCSIQEVSNVVHGYTQNEVVLNAAQTVLNRLELERQEAIALRISNLNSLN